MAYIHREKHLNRAVFTVNTGICLEKRYQWIIHDFFWYGDKDEGRTNYIICVVRGPFQYRPLIKPSKYRKQTFSRAVVCKYVIESDGTKRPFVADDLNRVPDREGDIISNRDPADYWDFCPVKWEVVE